MIQWMMTGMMVEDGGGDSGPYDCDDDVLMMEREITTARSNIASVMALDQTPAPPTAINMRRRLTINNRTRVHNTGAIQNIYDMDTHTHTHVHTNTHKRTYLLVGVDNFLGMGDESFGNGLEGVVSFRDAGRHQLQGSFSTRAGFMFNDSGD